MRPIRHTKRLDALLRRYCVHLREGCSTVSHATTGQVTLCDPLTFAVFEAAITSVYLSNALGPMWAMACESGHDRFYQMLAHRNGFELPDPTEVPESGRERRQQQATEDYHYCMSLIAKAGLYHALLD